MKDKGLFFLSSWCSTKHLYEIAELGLRGNLNYMDDFYPFPNSDKHYLKANPRGLVCHWMAGNVQILGLFALYFQHYYKLSKERVLQQNQDIPSWGMIY